MTNGEKIQQVFPEGKTRKCIGGVVFESNGWCHAYDSDWWDAEYKEPITKNCIACKYGETEEEDGEHCKKCLEGDSQFELGDDVMDIIRNRSLVTPQAPIKNDLGVEEHKGEVMDFPNTFDEFANEYGFKDKEEVYTNGSELIQVYRVKQWLEHINETTTMIDKSNFSQEQYKADLQSAYDCGYTQAYKDKITMPYATPDNCGNYIELTTKNDLGVDCISRAEAIRVASGYCHPSNVAKELAKLPSVTPQEPFKPMVEIDLYSVIKQKYIEREVLDRIRAEIDGLRKDPLISWASSEMIIDTILDILDKDKAESEEIDADSN